MTDPTWPPRDSEAYRHEAREKLGTELAGLFGTVEALILDADGVLTTGNLLFGPEGEALKEFDSHDGLGLVMARMVGIKRAVLTGRKSQIVVTRARELKFEAIRLGRYDKVAALEEILQELGCQAQHALYMGDDLVDLPALLQVGVPVTVPAAPAEVKEHCCYVTQSGGGAGAVREVVDLVLKCRGLYTVALRELSQTSTRPRAGGQK
jgi:3-deoxy-D-manno-octulosonate 8-phosphate phosphatase (KDO 8-P phosphatase)